MSNLSVLRLSTDRGSAREQPLSIVSIRHRDLETTTSHKGSLRDMNDMSSAHLNVQGMQATAAAADVCYTQVLKSSPNALPIYVQACTAQACQARHLHLFPRVNVLGAFFTYLFHHRLERRPITNALPRQPYLTYLPYLLLLTLSCPSQDHRRQHEAPHLSAAQNVRVPPAVQKAQQL